MSARRASSDFTPPLAPEAPEDDRIGEHATLGAHDEWEDERIVGADLSAAEAPSARFTRCELDGVALTGARLRGVALVDVLAVDCELSGALLQEAHLQRVEFRNCRMSGVVFAQSQLSHVRFVDCKVDDASFRLAEMDHVHMSGCSLVEADLYEAKWSASFLEQCDLTGADFSKAVVQGLRLAGSQLDGVRGALSMGGAVIDGAQVLPLALGLLGELSIEIRNEDD